MKAYTGRFPVKETDGDGNFWGMIDVLTLMLVFFIVLYAQEVPVIETAAQARLAESSTVAAPKEAESPEISQAAERHLDGLLGNGFYIAPAGENLTLVLEEKLSFASGQDMLAPEAVAILARVAGLLQAERDYDVVISGHTDDVPIHNGSFRSNWHLSAARAVTVAEYFLELGVAPRRITTQGLAEFQPLFPEDTSQNRARNRRVEITLLKKVKR